MNCPMATGLMSTEPKALSVRTIQVVAESPQEFSECDKIQLTNHHHHHQSPVLSMPPTSNDQKQVLYEPQQSKQPQTLSASKSKSHHEHQQDDYPSFMRERLLRLLSKVPIQVETIKPRQYEHRSPGSSPSTSNKQPVKVCTREPLIIKYYHEKSLNELIELHFACSLASQQQQNSDAYTLTDTCELASGPAQNNERVSFVAQNNLSANQQMTYLADSQQYPNNNWLANSSWPCENSFDLAKTKPTPSQPRRIKSIGSKSEFIGQQRLSFSQRKLNNKHRHQQTGTLTSAQTQPPGNVFQAQYSDSVHGHNGEPTYQFTGSQTSIVGHFYDQFSNQPLADPATSVQSFGPNYTSSSSCHFAASQHSLVGHTDHHLEQLHHQQQQPPVITNMAYGEPEMFPHYPHHQPFEAGQPVGGHEAAQWHQPQLQAQQTPQFFVSSETHQMIELGHPNHHHHLNATNQHNEQPGQGYLMDHHANSYSVVAAAATAPGESFESPPPLSSYADQVNLQARPQVQLTVAYDYRRHHHHHHHQQQQHHLHLNHLSASTSSCSSTSSSSSSSSSSSGSSTSNSTSSLQLDNVKQTAAPNLVK